MQKRLFNFSFGIGSQCSVFRIKANRSRIYTVLLSIQTIYSWLWPLLGNKRHLSTNRDGRGKENQFFQNRAHIELVKLLRPPAAQSIKAMVAELKPFWKPGNQCWYQSSAFKTGFSYTTHPHTRSSHGRWEERESKRGVKVRNLTKADQLILFYRRVGFRLFRFNVCGRETEKKEKFFRKFGISNNLFRYLRPDNGDHYQSEENINAGFCEVQSINDFCQYLEKPITGCW